MSEVSKNCNLSRIYTNHCIRVTGASILTRMKFSSSESMSVTGHKSVQSLAIYQKTGEKTKKEMASVIGQAMSTCDENLQRQLPPPPPQLLHYPRLRRRPLQRLKTKKIARMPLSLLRQIWMRMVTKQFQVST